MNRKLLFLLVLTVIIVVASYWVLGRDFNWSLFVSSLWNVQPIWLMASIAATLFTYVARAFRWQVLLNPLKSVRMGQLISTNVLGFSAIYLIGRAGELVRPVWLTRRELIPLTASVATIIVERFLDMVMLIALFGWALLLVKLPSAAVHTVTLMKSKAWVLIAGSIGAMIFLFFFRSNVERIVRYIPVARLALLLRSFSEGLSF